MPQALHLRVAGETMGDAELVERKLERGPQGLGLEIDADGYVSALNSDTARQAGVDVGWRIVRVLAGAGIWTKTEGKAEIVAALKNAPPARPVALKFQTAEQTAVLRWGVKGLGLVISDAGASSSPSINVIIKACPTLDLVVATLTGRWKGGGDGRSGGRRLRGGWR